MLSAADRDTRPVLDFFSSRGIDVFLLVPTRTGLEKSIMDATVMVRNLLRDLGIHDYETQGQGPENKATFPAYLVGSSRAITSTASLYRPNTKQGDPRIWFTGLKDFAKPYNVLAIAWNDGAFHVFNTSDPATWAAMQDNTSFPGKLLGELIEDELEPAVELIDKLREIASRGFVESIGHGPRAVGETLEHLLGISPNPRGTPDFKGIELKAGRRLSSGRKASMQTIFSKTPDWNQSNLSSGLQILEKYGYDRNGRLQAYCTMEAPSSNTLGWQLEVDEEADTLFAGMVTSKGFTRELTWNIAILRKRLATKHPATMWVAANYKVDGGTELFHYRKAKLTREPLVAMLGPRLGDGSVKVDLTLSLKPSGVARDHGYLFRMREEDMHVLFPDPIEYGLLST